jgi:hypothetical protein
MDVYGTFQRLLLQPRSQIPALTLKRMPKTPKRLVCAQPSRTPRPASKTDATGTYQQLLLQARSQIPVLTTLMMLRTLKRLDSAKPTMTNKLANMKDAHGFYQLLLLHLKLQAHALTWTLMLRTPRKLVSAGLLRTPRLANKMVATGTYQSLLSQTKLMKSVLTQPLMFRIPIRSISVEILRINKSANKMDVCGTRLHSTRSQAINQIPVLINPARTIMSNKLTSVKDSQHKSIADKTNVYGTFHQLWLQTRYQIPVPTMIRMPRTLHRSKCVQTSRILRHVSKTVATGTYQLQ